MSYNNVVINVDGISRRKSMYFATLLSEKFKSVTENTVSLNAVVSEPQRDNFGIITPESMIEIIKETESVYKSNKNFKIVFQGINSLYIFDNMNSYLGVMKDFLMSVTKNSISINILLVPAGERHRVFENGLTYDLIRKRASALRVIYKEDCRFADSHRYTFILDEDIMLDCKLMSKWIEALVSFIRVVKAKRHIYRHHDKKISTCIAKYVRENMMNKGLKGLICLSMNYKNFKSLGGDYENRLDRLYSEYSKYERSDRYEGGTNG